ncbi:hypothetical protein TVAG_050940 [Trichomonas vaginalis G3]|uniref:Importin N-terminal domain-containing protein n=1 Tax=Trichomonas vaginalis (strain ATCC PRA-98 / G3) TaxID=412133 RepID=A2EEQ3_TRIV3|nr:armadillo (ARM) repeat-containing protein family [Trichomonas vaginalis G3]EAY08859.1 hypothetical protein TVAG_050940 [Trichomonas vaginalis G3]KAI5489355.1 armadillo (ARM) repeat-containing protein family [Trichomonas vaginalis G3]|eukprot:XP_001321082.1 hypothetical protein [Trichomonas vaginalis G3]
MSKIHKQDFLNSQIQPQVKQLFFEILHSETDQIIQNLLIASIELLTCIANGQWPELIPYSIECAGLGTQQSLFIATSLLSIAEFHIEPEDLSGLVPEINQMIVNALSFNNNVELVKSAGLLFANTICKLNEEFPETIRPSLDNLLRILQENLSNATPIARHICDSLERSITQAGVMNPMELTQNLLQILTPSISPGNIYTLFLPISKCFMTFPRDMREMIPQFIESIIKYSDLQFDTNVSAYEQSDCRDLFEIIFAEINATRLWEMIHELFVYEGQGSAFTIILILDTFIMHDPYVALNNLSTIMGFLASILSNEEFCMAVREAAFSALTNFISESNHSLDAYSEDIYNLIVANLQIEGISDDLRREIIYCLMECMENLPTPAENYEFIWDVIKTSIQISNLVSLSLECLQIFITLGGKELSSIYQEIISIISDAMEVDQTADQLIRGNAIIALGHLLAADNSLMQEPNLLQTIIEAAQSDDFDLQCASVSAMSCIIAEPVQGIEELVPLGLNLVKSICNGDILTTLVKMNDIGEEEDMNDDGDNRKSSKAMDAINTLNQCFTLLKSIVEIYPNSLNREDVDEFMNILTSYFSVFNLDPMLARCSLETAVSMTIKYQLNAEELLENASELTTVPNAELAGIFFQAADLLFNTNTLSQDFVFRPDEGLFAETMTALKHKLPIQQVDGPGNDDDEDDLPFEGDDEDAPANLEQETKFEAKLMPNVYKLCIDIISKYPNEINPTEIVQACKSCVKSDSNEASACSQVIAALFKYCGDKLHTIARSEAVKLIVTAIGEIDGNTTPYVLVSARTIVNSNPQILEKHLSKLFDDSSSFVQSDNQGQAYYFQTKTAAVAFICSLVQNGMIELSEALPIIIEAFPLEIGFDDCSSVAYSTLLTAFNQSDQETKERLAQIFVHCASLDQRGKSKLLISDDVFSNVVRVAQQFASI